MSSSMKRYSLISKLNSCNGFNAFIVMDNLTKNKIVIKAYDEKNELLTNEINILKSLKHNNIVKYIDHSNGDNGIEINTEERYGYFLTNIYISLQYCENGDLSNKILKSKENFSENQIQKWIYQATDALAYLHSKNYVHRDIKPANILLTKEDDIKLCDFTLASYIECEEQEADCVGTSAYMSPEIMKAFETCDIKLVSYLKSDIWSLGCILYELIYLKLAFPKGQRDNPPLPDLRDSGRFSTILPKMLEKDPEKRISSKDLLTELTKLDSKNIEENEALKRELEKLRLEKEQADDRERQLREELIREKRKNQENISTSSSRLPSERMNNSSAGSSSSGKVIFVEEEFLDHNLGKTFSSRYKTEESLGSGAYGKVYLVTDLAINTKKAMKLMDKDKTSINELNVIKKLNHENVVKYFDHLELAVSKKELSYICIITEYCHNGDLKKRITEIKKSNSTFSKEEIFKWIFEATSGVRYIHTNGIIHRDIKPANILFSRENVVKIGDLGLAKEIRIRDPTTFTFAGTVSYMSPQQYRCLDKNIKYGYKTDVWSLGCVLFELIQLKKAYENGPKEDSASLTFSGLGLFSSILNAMLKWNEDDRIDSATLFENLSVIFYGFSTCDKTNSLKKIHETMSLLDY